MMSKYLRDASWFESHRASCISISIRYSRLREGWCDIFVAQITNRVCQWLIIGTSWLQILLLLGEQGCRCHGLGLFFIILLRKFIRIVWLCYQSLVLILLKNHSSCNYRKSILVICSQKDKRGKAEILTWMVEHKGLCWLLVFPFSFPLLTTGGHVWIRTVF